MLEKLILGLTVNHAKLELDDLPGSPVEIAGKLNVAFDSHRQWETISQAGKDDQIVLHAIRRTKLFGFVDDVRIELSSDQDGQTRLYASSRSRVGKGDLGQNARNLQQMKAWL
ncbi:hypothetical protein LF1_02090 [Rubripirellula obstinata]|uniref:DUF1499 domain-containing protein n=1 Tax=Rubripirellula obstinata TaxID=406547 RepID=A0A5B1CDQ0_9BACT|nr:DUF1499 domain-containing protein [Rubripirellula obstinata]KAA1257720.1 hypothetical protein LF1_02090 [Rubripirellula obstinata]